METCLPQAGVPEQSNNTRRGARAVEWASLLRKCAGNRTEGSNPSLSAILILNIIGYPELKSRARDSKDGDAPAVQGKASSRGRAHLVELERSEQLYLVTGDRIFHSEKTMDPNSVPQPIVNLGKATLSKAANKFVDFLIKKHTGKSAKVFEAEGDVESDKILSRWNEIEKPMWLQAEAVKMNRQYANFGNVLQKASEHVTAEENKVADDNDLFWGLTEHAKEITNEEMQNLIAKIIASEYNTPGTYSMSTLQILKSLGKVELEKLSFLASFYLFDHGFLQDFFGMNKEVVDIRTKLNINYSDFLELQNLGLIQAGNYTAVVDVKKEALFTIKSPTKTYSIKITKDLENWNFPNCYELTIAGRQILQHLEVKHSDIFEEWLKKYLREKGLEIQN